MDVHGYGEERGRSGRSGGRRGSPEDTKNGGDVHVLRQAILAALGHDSLRSGRGMTEGRPGYL